MPFDSLTGRRFLGDFRNRFSISQSKDALIVVPFGMNSVCLSVNKKQRHHRLSYRRNSLTLCSCRGTVMFPFGRAAFRFK